MSLGMTKWAFWFFFKEEKKKKKTAGMLKKKKGHEHSSFFVAVPKIHPQRNIYNLLLLLLPLLTWNL